MTSGSRFIAVAIAALAVSAASVGFLGARRSHNRAEVPPTAAASPEPTPAPAATPSPEASPSVQPEPSPRQVAPVASKRSAPKMSSRRETAVHTPTAEPVRQMPAAEPTVETPPPAPPATKPVVDPAPVPRPAPVIESAAVETPKRQLEERTVSADTVVGIRIDGSVSSASAKLEDRVTGVVSRDVIVDGRTVVPAGTKLEGNVTLVQPGSKFKGRARLGIRFHTLVMGDGLRVPIQTEALFRDGDSATASTAKKVGTGAGVGAVIGAVLGGKRGAILGAGVGAGGGTAAVMAGDANEAVIESGSALTMRLTSPVTITIER